MRAGKACTLPRGTNKPPASSRAFGRLDRHIGPPAEHREPFAVPIGRFAEHREPLRVYIRPPAIPIGPPAGFRESLAEHREPFAELREPAELLTAAVTAACLRRPVGAVYRVQAVLAAGPDGSAVGAATGPDPAGSSMSKSLPIPSPAS